MEPTALAWLRQPPPGLPDLLERVELGPTMWQALIRDGVANLVWGDLAIPADRPETPAARAAAVRPLVPPRAVVGREAAVWVHTGGPRPERIDVLVAPNARRPDPHPQRVPHECSLRVDDAVGVGPLRVTTVERTALDVARWSRGPEAAALLERLVDLCGLDPRGALARLDALAGHRGVHTASARLTSLCARATPAPAVPTR